MKEKKQFVYKCILLGALVLGLFLLPGCAGQPDPVEDPLSAFEIDAVLPFATVAPEALAPTPTPAPAVDPDKLVTDTDYCPSWKQDGAYDWGDEPDPTPRPTPRPTPPPVQEPEYQRLSYGDTGSMVRSLQKRLKSLGYYTGTVDGDYGTGTVAAVKKFQSIVGLSQSGVATVALQQELFSAGAPRYSPPATPKPTAAPKPPATPKPQYIKLERGSSGSRVTRLQTRLKTLGYYSGAVDGAYGSGTVAAVKKFQKAIGLDRTGVATVALQKKLFSAGAPYYEADEPEYEEEEEIYVLLSPGDTGERVKKLQRRLKALGWFDGAIGGNYLRKTTEAVKAFQKAINVKQTGTATVALQKKLFADSAPRKEQEPIPTPEPTPTPKPQYILLQKGSRGSAVRRLQQRLKELGYFRQRVTINYGSATVTAVKAFEARYGREQTGIATVALQKKLFSDDALPYASQQEENQEQTYTVMKKGDSGAKVKKLQRRLKELGYFEGAIGGNYQKLTTDAVKRFQKAAGLKVTGIANVPTQELLYSNDAPIYKASGGTVPKTNMVLRKGDTGEAVEALQLRLIDLGYIRDGGAIKLGTFDKLTEYAVIDAQFARGYDSEGVADEEFLAYIYSEDVWDVVLEGYEGG